MNKKRVLSLSLALTLCLGLALPAGAASDKPEESDNYAKQNYGRWAVPIKSHLYENGDGGLTRVEYVNDHVVVEDYDSDFHFLSGRTVQPELALWGGFYAGEDYNFLVWGQNNEEEDDTKEVVRVVKYDKDWNRLGAASLKGANTYHPFDAGSCRFAEYGGELYLRTCHEMYTTSDGLNHQASVTLCVRESDMTITDSWYDIMNITYGYVSHSFNQFVLVDSDRNIVCLDHGDANPRSAVLMVYPTKAGNGKFSADYFNQTSYVDVQTYAGRKGDNTTGGVVGGLGETSRGYLVAHAYDGQGGGGTKVPYLAFVSKSGLSVSNRALPFDSNKSACPPFLVSTGADSGYVLWAQANDGANSGVTWYRIGADGSRVAYTPATEHVDDTLSYVTYSADGSFGSVITAENAPLSDCQPIFYNGKVTWYVTNQSAPTFYTLDSSGVTAHPAAQADLEPTPTPTPAPTPSAGPAPMPAREDIPAAGQAYASTQTIRLDGVPVEFQAYALKDQNGNDTNYMKLRDVAWWLTGTGAQFDVDWNDDQKAINVLSGSAYLHMSGTELSTPFSGNRSYRAYYGETLVNGVSVPFTAITLTDDQGGGYTYYKLRDLGMALGFNVGWDAEAHTIFVESDKPYTSAD